MHFFIVECFTLLNLLYLIDDSFNYVDGREADLLRTLTPFFLSFSLKRILCILLLLFAIRKFKNYKYIYIYIFMHSQQVQPVLIRNSTNDQGC